MARLSGRQQGGMGFYPASALDLEAMILWKQIQNFWKADYSYVCVQYYIDIVTAKWMYSALLYSQTSLNIT